MVFFLCYNVWISFSAYVQSYAQLESANDQIKKSQAIVFLETPSSLRFFLSYSSPLT